YSGNFQHIVYLLTDKVSPTKYVHRGMITNERLKKALKIDEDAEVRKILSKKPEFIIIDRGFSNHLLNEALRLEYEKVKTFEKDVYVYKRLKLKTKRH
ncbi:hypothetical protein ACFLSA_07300, partial [Bacteroidota bacterium]